MGNQEHDPKPGTEASGPSGDAKEGERRLHPRRRMFKGGKVVFNDRACVVDCVVRDLSNTGARLVFKDFQPLPQRFQLVIQELGTYECEVVRHHQTEYGVRFISKG